MSNSDATTPIDRPHPRAIVAGHGEFAAGLVSAVQQITGRGDQLIHVNVWTPQNFTHEEKEMLDRMNTSPNFKPQPGKSEKSFFEKVKEVFS